MPKRMSTTLPTRQAGRFAACGALLLSAGLAGPALAQTTTPPAAPALPTAVPGAPAAAAPMPNTTMPASAPADAAPAGGPVSQAQLQATLGKEKASKIEAHIERLHGDLKITAAQEPAWQAFAGTMRANAVQMDSAYTHRQQNYAGMNAVQDLQSYGEVEQTNARNIAQLLPRFQALYAALSPQQQKLADGIFVRHIDKAVKKNG